MRTYINTLLESGEMRIVEREVDGRFELAAVTARSQRESERPILFRKVRGSALPVVSNIFGSRRRLCDLIGAKDGSFCRRWTELMRQVGQDLPGFSNLAGLADFEDLKLSDLPQITYHEKDAGPYITAGIFLAKEPETGVLNLSFHRCMYVSDAELRVRLGTSHHLTRYQAKAEGASEALEAAILLGPPPEFVLAAAAPIPYDESELGVVGRLAGAPIPMRRCRHLDLEVPAETEIVIEGRFLPNVRRPEAPFGEFLGFYVPQGNNHVFEVLGVTCRRGATYHALVCGSPEDLRLLELAFATQVYQHLHAILPGIIDVSCIPNIMNIVVKIEQQYEGHARQVLLSALGVNHDFGKSCMVVDEDVDINDLNDVYWAFLTRGRADTRVFTIPDVPGFYRDPHKDHWGRLAIDATVPFGRKDDFVRKSIPGADRLDLRDYFV
ncbi:MAG: UbiD family decarboxylase [Anaerolineales bacterium]|nr:UbiD family decarboxylase [Anaerolineales bacterium]